MNRNELLSELASKTGFKKSDAGVFLDAFIETVQETLKGNDEVRLIGFGTFLSTYVPESEGRNPRDGSPLKIAARYQPKFKPGQTLKNFINNK